MDAGRAYSPAVRKLCDERGAVLIFDEIVTGFRLAMGGAGEYFGVRPDLAVFAKGIANGMPLAAYLGRRELMRQIEGPVSISSTYAGETLSLAACRAVIETYRREDVIAGLWRRGRQWQEGADAIFAARGLPMRLRGAAVCPQIVFDAAAEAPAGLAEAFFRAAWRNGLSLYTVTYVNHAHTAAEIAEALSRLDAACGEIAS
jgi:glutamate-1-semialdehyde 2,1-aminomutase